MSKPIAIFTTRSRADRDGRQDFEVAWTEQQAPGYGSPRSDARRGVLTAAVAEFRARGFDIQIRREER